MNAKDIIALANAGFTADQIAKIAQADEPAPAPAAEPAAAVPEADVPQAGMPEADAAPAEQVDSGV